MAASPTNRLRAELERLGATFRKGRAGYISLTDYGQSVALSGPTNEEPRRWWRGSSSKALELLAPLPDGADLDTIWQALHAVPGHLEGEEVSAKFEDLTVAQVRAHASGEGAVQR